MKVHLKPCPECNGSGTMTYERVLRHSPSRDVGIIEEYEDNCENCHGSGEIEADEDEEMDLAKWKVTDESAFEGAIRAVNYFDGTHRPKDAFGNEGPEMPVIKHRLEQLGPWGWQPIPVYQEQPDGTLTEIPQ